MLLNRRNLLVVFACTYTLVGCHTVSGPNVLIQTQVVELTPAPATTTVVRQQSRIVIRGGLLASCAPYGLSGAAQAFDDTLVVTLTGAVVGTVCPEDVVWTKGYVATVTGAPAGIRMLRVVHATDIPGSTSDVIHEGAITP